MENEVIFLISPSDLSLLIYRTARDFCLLILFPAMLHISLISSSFLVAFLGFSMYRIMSSAKIDNSTSFPILISFIYFSSLIALARISKSLLSNSDESDHPCLVPDLRVNAFSYSSSMVFPVGLSYYGLYCIKVGFL